MFTVSIGQTQPLPTIYWVIVAVWGSLEILGLVIGVTLTVRWQPVRRLDAPRAYWNWAAIHGVALAFTVIAGLLAHS